VRGVLRRSRLSRPVKKSNLHHRLNHMSYPIWKSYHLICIALATTEELEFMGFGITSLKSGFCGLIEWAGMGVGRCQRRIGGLFGI